MTRAVLVVPVVVLSLAATEARANAPVDAAISVAHQTRRAIAIGPHVGGYGGYALEPGAGVQGVTFGIGVYVFRRPSVLTLRETVSAEIERQVKLRLSGDASLDPATVRTEVTAAVLEEIKREPPRRTREPPRWSLLLEGAVGLGNDGGFAIRALGSRGFGPISAGLALGAQFVDDEVRFVPGVELDLRLTPIGAYRTPVFALYTRGELALTDDDAVPITLLGGVRVMLDVL